MLMIEQIENAKKNRNGDNAINRELFHAYVESQDYKNELINLNDAIREPEAIVEACRELGITEFTISSGYSDMINTLAEFAKYGCKVNGFTKVNDGSGRFEPSIKIAALKMKIA